MLVFIVLFACITTSYSQNEQLLGGWTTSTDESLKQDCLRKALVYLRGSNIGDDLQSQVMDVVCRTQIVNGLNIRLSFSLGQEKWQCSFYKSFVQTIDMQLEQCQRAEDEEHPAADAENNNDDNEKEEQEEEEEEVKDRDTNQEQPQADDAKIDAVNQQVADDDADDNDDN